MIRWRLIKFHDAKVSKARDKKLFAALKEEFEKLDPDPESKVHRFNMDLFGAIEDRLELHRDLLLRTTRRYSLGSLALAIMIPIGSATLTWIATCETSNSCHITLFSGIHYNFGDINLGAFGLLLTILTILNSIFRPTERYMTASHLLVDLHDWEMDLVIKLRVMLSKQEQIRAELAQLKDKSEQMKVELEKKGKEVALLEQIDQIYGFLQRKDKELSEYGGSIVDRLLQLEISERGGEDKQK